MGAEQTRGQHAGPGIEQHHDLGAGFDLGGKIGDRRLGQTVQQGGKQVRLRVGHGAGGQEVLRAAAFDHVAGHGEGRAGEADQGGAVVALGSQAGPGPADRFQDRRDRIGQAREIEPGHAGGIA